MNITTEYKLPIIDGFVVIPGDEVHRPTRLTPEQVLDAISGTSIGTFITDTTGMAPQGNLVRTYDDPKRPQKWVVFPAFSAPGQYPADWFATLRAL